MRAAVAPDIKTLTRAGQKREANPEYTSYT
jgi:hypothetical protein